VHKPERWRCVYETMVILRARGKLFSLVDARDDAEGDFYPRDKVARNVAPVA